MASKQVNLYVNDALIEIDYFVQGFIDHVMSGILTALRGTCRIKNLDLSIEKDTVNIDLNGSAVPINDFVNKIIRNTVVGMVASLKGVGEVKKLKIEISR